ncbi:MAG: TonB family protein, partial [Gemmatirosa sp.]
RLALASLAACLAAPGAARAQGDTTGTVSGIVRGPGGVSIVGAEVVLTPATPPGGGTVFARRVFTDDAGRFRVGGLPNGRASVAVRRIGYRPMVRQLEVPIAEALALALEAVPQTMTTVVVRDRRVRHTGWAAQFYERRERGMGRYITKEDLDRRNAIRTTDVLRSVPGLTISSSGMRGSAIRMRGARCDPLIWIDGTPALAGYLDVDNFQPNTLEGIEVYSGVSTVPVELRGPRGEETCGVIALWSRMPEPRRRGPKKSYTADELAALVATATVYTADQVDQAAQPDSANPIAPYYPDALKRTRTAGEVLVEFVVDTAGVPELETVGIVAASHPAFALAARDAVGAARFSPAIRAGKPVRQLVQVPVRFELTGS